MGPISRDNLPGDAQLAGTLLGTSFDPVRAVIKRRRVRRYLAQVSLTCAALAIVGALVTGFIWLTSTFSLESLSALGN